MPLREDVRAWRGLGKGLALKTSHNMRLRKKSKSHQLVQMPYQIIDDFHYHAIRNEIKKLC